MKDPPPNQRQKLVFRTCTSKRSMEPMYEPLSLAVGMVQQERRSKFPGYWTGVWNPGSVWTVLPSQATYLRKSGILLCTLKVALYKGNLVKVLRDQVSDNPSDSVPDYFCSSVQNVYSIRLHSP